VLTHWQSYTSGGFWPLESVFSLGNLEMITGFLTIGLLLWCVLFCSVASVAPGVASPGAQAAQRGHSAFKVREVNVYAPHVYADDLNFVATLVDLPGAKKKQSYWELSYQLFFISEDRFDQVVERLPRGPANLTPAQFPGRMLLTEGRQKITRLGTLQERTVNRTGVHFKQRVPDIQRTKFARLMTHYSIKIFDAELNTTLYKSGIFLTEPFEDDPQNQAIARKTIYLNFMVTPDGFLNYSQLARQVGSTKW
jgi:hypothetical protein